MIDLYTWTTPNGRKASIMLEEIGLPYTVHAIDISKDEQFAPAFLKIAPNNRIPAIVDTDTGMSLMESGAILIYLADKTGKLLPKSGKERYQVIEWLMWQMAGLGPMLGQHGHFKLYAPEPIAYATERYRRETLRLYGVLDRQLSSNPYVAGADYSIADMACFPWIQTYKAQEIDIDEFAGIRRWYDVLKARPGLRRGMDVGRERINRNPQADAETRAVLFGIKKD